MRIGFAKREITPPVGTLLGGYAGYRPCSGIHDPLYCKAVVLEQEGRLYALAVLDLMCVDEPLYLHIADAVADLGISREQLIVSAIHSHAAPRGVVFGEGVLAGINCEPEDGEPEFRAYTEFVIGQARDAIRQALESLEAFQVRTARGKTPTVGSERHTGKEPGGNLTVLQFRTESGKDLILCNFPCHPTVTNAANLLVTADFAGTMEEKLGADMAVFVNGAAGDISTRFTRRESSFAECQRLGAVGAEAVLSLISQEEYREPAPLKGIRSDVTLKARPVERVETAKGKLEETEKGWKQAEAAGEDPTRVRLLKSLAEGAWVSLEFAQKLQGVTELSLPVTVFRFCGMDFVTVPGELFSTLQPEDSSVIGYANGYFRYIAGEDAYEAGYYEAMASIAARGQGEVLNHHMKQLLCQLNKL